MKNKGIDYGMGQLNVDKSTGIRFGVLPQNEVLQAWADSSEPDYGKPHCPKCVTMLTEGLEEGNTCEHCGCEIVDLSDCYPESPIAHNYDKDGYAATCGEDGDIFVLKSPYYTHAQFCSPCAPGACYLLNPLDFDSMPHDADCAKRQHGAAECDCSKGRAMADNRAYCLGHDWFDGEKAPYPVYSVETGKQIMSIRKSIPCPNCNGSGRDTLARVASVRGCKPSEVDVKQLSVTDFRESDGSFNCWRCDGKGHIAETVYEES